MCRRLLLGAVVAVLTVGARASAQAGGSSRAGLLLALPTDTRSLGLADAAAAATGGPWSVFVAPAQLAGVQRTTFGVATERYLAATQLSAASVAIRAGRGVLGIGVTVLDYGTISEIATTVPGTDGVETGRTYSASDHALVVGYGYQSGKRTRLGAAVEVVGTRIADLSGSGVALSANIVHTLAGGWALAGGAYHIGPDVRVGATSGALPAAVRLSAAAPEWRAWRFAVRPMLEGRAVRGGATEGVVAAEARLAGERGAGLSLRGGYSFRSGAVSDRSPLAVGVGAIFGSFALDYAVERFGTIDQVTHRIGMTYSRSAGAGASQRPSRARDR